MSQTTADKIAMRLSRATLVMGMATAVVAVAATNIGQTAQAAELLEGGSKSTISVEVRAVQITITQINDTVFDNQSLVDNIAIRTYQSKNEVHFKANQDAHVTLMLGDKVLWEGDVKKDQPTVATFDLGETAVGIYNLALRGYTTEDREHYSVTFFHLDYRAMIPSIIPDNDQTVIHSNGNVSAPNTGMYVTIGGRVYSMTTVAFLLLLTAVAVFLICSKFGKRQPATATVKTTVKKTKKPRKPMDMI